MPRWSFAALLFLRLTSRARGAEIRFFEVPRYLAFLARIVRCRSDRLAQRIGRCLGWPIVHMDMGEGERDWGSDAIGMLEAASDLTLEMKDEVAQDGLVQSLRNWLGNGPAMSFALQYYVESHVRPHLLPVALLANSEPAAQLVMVWDCRRDTKLEKLVQERLGKTAVCSFRWPPGYWFVRGLIDRVLAVGGCLIWLLRGIGIGSGNRPEAGCYRLMTECTDPLRLNGTAYDNDFLCDGDRIKPEDFILYVTRLQAKRLVRFGYSRSEIEKVVENKGYKVIWTDKAALRPRRLFSLLWRMMPMLTGRGGNGPGFQIYHLAWLRFREFAGIFDHYSAEAFLHLRFPNGRAGVSTDSGVLASLVRSTGGRIFGCQNRSIYSRQSEYAFDCYDNYMVWGRAWSDSLKGLLDYVDRVSEVGCLFLDSLVARKERAATSSAIENGSGRITLVAFTTDLERGVYSVDYNVNFLRRCILAAERHDDVVLRIKVKDPEHVDFFRRHSETKSLLNRLGDRVSFADHTRFEYSDTLLSADVVLAIAFTTPGVEGLLLGKKSLYYSELGVAGKAMDVVPGFVNKSANSFDRGLDEDLSDLRSRLDDGAVNNGVDLLDPYRDGNARERMLDVMFGNVDTLPAAGLN